MTAVAAVTALAVPQSDAGAALSPGKPHKKVCTKGPAKRAECHAEVITQADGVTPDGSTSRPAGSYGPAELKSAYALPGGTAGSGKTIAIVDSFDNPNAESDLGNYRSAVGLTACTTANGCFKKVNQAGNPGPYPPGNTGWGGEIDLDLQAASATCPACKLLLVEASSDFSDDLAAGVDTAARLGATVISNSYGANEASDVPGYESHYNHPGIAITASSGDDGYDGIRPSYPASSRYVTGVGGTHLVRSSTARGWTESAWTGAGSGCSSYISKPTWQKDTGCSKKTVADVSAVADPNTGFAVYDSYGSTGGNWFQYGGTSLAAPIVAAVFAMGGATDPSYPYAHASSLNDVTSGTNGTCATYICKSATGYDGPTGLGTPNGLGAFGGAPVTTTTTTTRPATTTTRPATTTTGPAATTTTTRPATTTTTPPTTTTTRPATTTTTTRPATTTTTRPATTTTVAATKPSAPQNAQVASTTGGITVCWSPPATGSPILSYKVYRGGWNSETYLTTVPGSATCFNDTSAPMWTWFYYRVTAVNGAGEGPPSADVGANRTA